MIVLIGTSAEAMHFHTHSAQTQPLSKKTNGNCLVCHSGITFLPTTSSPAFSAALAVQGFTSLRLFPDLDNVSVFDLVVRPPPISA